MRRFKRFNPFCHPRSRKTSTLLWTIPVNYSFAPFLSEKFKFKNFTGFTYRLKNTFDNKKLQKIHNLNFDLKTSGEGLLRYLNKIYIHRKYIIHKYQKIERSITINKAKGNIKLNLLTKETINETLSKIKNEKVREKIKYVYLVRVLMKIKSLSLKIQIHQ